MPQLLGIRITNFKSLADVTLPIGTSVFGKIRQNGCRLVDKTTFVREIIEGSKILKGVLCFLIALGCLAEMSTAYAEKPMRVVFLNPDTPENKFWGSVTSFMQAAADDIGIELRVVHSKVKHALEYRQLADQILRSSNRPDYLIFIFKTGVGGDMLRAAENAKVSSFVFNTDLQSEEKAELGEPRGKFKYWIGHSTPDDIQAGYDLAKTLIFEAQQKKNIDKNGKTHIIGLSGTRDSTAALQRNMGLERAIQEQQNAILRQIVFAEWNQQKAANIAFGLLARYPETTVIWNASDGMALGSVQAIENLGKIPGQHILTGGIDWTMEGMEAVRDGKMTASMGGHFMDGAWLLILLYDYHHGMDFANTMGTKMKSRMQIIDKDNVQDFLTKLGGENWKRVDFKQFSKVHNPSLKNYDFSLNAILSQ